MKQITIFYIPTPNRKVAEEIACDLLDKKLIACANIVDSGSIYVWEDEVQRENEALLLVKAFNENVDAIHEHVEKIHPYKTPLIGHYACNVNDAYFAWMKTVVL